MSTILKIEGLSHKYSSSWAIRDINLEINQAGIIGLLGSNGAGKSTTMNIICGVLNQTAGKVFVDGLNMRKEPEAAKKAIGFLPQNPPLYTDLTIDEYLSYCARLRHIEKSMIRKAVEEVKDRCGLGHISSRLIRNLSGGYRQRVGIAQAIIHKPKLVVMDEPTNGLDPNQMIEARKLIKEIGVDHTVLLSSHIMSEIHLLCKDIVMIEAGRIVFSDSMDVFNNYIHPHSVFMQLENPPSLAELLAIQGVTAAEFLTEKEIRIHFDGNEDITEKLAASCVQNGWRLRGMNVEKHSPDEIFKQLSTQAIQ